MVKKMLQKSIGADITINLKYFPPFKVLPGVLPHDNFLRKLEKAVLIRKERRVFNRKKKMCMIFS